MLKLSAMCNLLSGFVKRKVLGAKGKVKNERQWTGFTGWTGLDSRDLGGLSDWLSDSLGAGGLRETNTEFGCLFPVAAVASCEPLAGPQPAQNVRKSVEHAQERKGEQQNRKLDQPGCC